MPLGDHEATVLSWLGILWRKDRNGGCAQSMRRFDDNWRGTRDTFLPVKKQYQ